jgi:hypothetical protein
MNSGGVSAARNVTISSLSKIIRNLRTKNYSWRNGLERNKNKNN